MKKTLTALATAAVAVSLVGSAQAATAAPTTKAPPAVSAATRAADLSKLKLGKGTLSAKQLKALGLKPITGKELARVKKLQQTNSDAAKTSSLTVGAYAWYTWQNARNSWVDRRYSGPYYSYPWYPYYVIYDNFKTCTYSGTDCLDAHAYTYQYYLYYYPNSTWYYYNTGGYQSNSTDYSGWGPFAS